MRILPVATLTAAALASAAVALAPPSQAGSPLTFAELRNDLAGCTGTVESPFVETITMDLSNTSTILPVGCVAVLDLGASHVRAYSVLIRPGKQLTVRGTSGTLTVATTDGNEPGIETTGASLVVEGGNVTAKGNQGAAAIGSRSGAAAGVVTVTGGTVVATGGGGAAGIGNGTKGATAGSSYTQTGGTVTARGGRCGAGVGGGSDSSGLTVDISGGTLVALGDGVGPGIGAGCGGGQGVTSKPVTITGGTVTAQGGSEGGAGVGPGGTDGGGPLPAGGAVTVTGGTLDATGRAYGAGIGGNFSGGGPVRITGGVVTARADDPTSAVGAGGFGTGFGSLEVSGTGVLRLPSGSLIVPDSDPTGPEVTVADAGRVSGSADPSPTYATISGEGQIDNGGVIDLPTANVTSGGVTVSHRHYDVTFDAGAGTPADDTPAGPVTVYADTFDHGDRAFPSAPTPPPGQAFTGWTGRSADGTSHPLSVDADLTTFGDAPGVAGDDALAITAVAVYRSTSPRPTLALAGGHAVAAGSRHVFTGKARPGTAVSLYAGTRAVGSATASSSGAFALPASITTSAAYAAVADGQASAPVKVTAVKLTLKVNGPTPIRAGTHKLTGAAPAGRSVTLLVDGKTFDRTTAKAGNTYSFTESLAGRAGFRILSDGVKTPTLTINAQPAAGSGAPGTSSPLARAIDRAGDVAYRDTATGARGVASAVAGIDLVAAAARLDHHSLRLTAITRGPLPTSGRAGRNAVTLRWRLVADGRPLTVTTGPHGTQVRSGDTLQHCGGVQTLSQGRRSVLVVSRHCLGSPTTVRASSQINWVRQATHRILTDATTVLPAVSLGG